MIGMPAAATRPDVVALLIAAYATEVPWATLAAMQSAVAPTEAERVEAEAQVIAAMRKAQVGPSVAQGEGGTVDRRSL